LSGFAFVLANLHPAQLTIAEVSFARPRFNPKRRIRPPLQSAQEIALFERLAAKVSYRGSNLHKRNPGDFGLSQPPSPRLNKTLCENAGNFNKATALALLRAGLRCGMVSIRQVGEWPQTIWSVTPNGYPMEAQRESDGVYHGYPLKDDDDFRVEVLKEWKRRHNA
jgi:hypothetical protein